MLLETLNLMPQLPVAPKTGLATAYFKAHPSSISPSLPSKRNKEQGRLFIERLKRPVAEDSLAKGTFSPAISSQGRDLPESQPGNLKGNPWSLGTLALVPHSFLGKPKDKKSCLSLEEHKARTMVEKKKSGVENKDV